jgi:glycosyltransferase involved in cell wall biosynthesis
MGPRKALKSRLRDAYRVARGKPLKYTQVSPPSHPVATHSWPLTESDLDLLVREISRGPSSILMVGTADVRITLAVLAGLSSSQSLEIVVGPGAEPQAAGVDWPGEPIRSAGDLAIDCRRVECPEEIFRAAADPAEGTGQQSRSNHSSCESRLMVVNASLNTEQLQRLLELGGQAGCSAAVGWGFNAAEHQRVMAIRALGPMHGTDNVWSVQLTTDESLKLGRNRGRAHPGAAEPKDLTDPEPRSILRFPAATGSRETAAPKVSIIVPAYRARSYLPHALHDIASQSYRNWELVVVEDGSPDTVQDLVETFRDTSLERSVIYHRLAGNLGASTARNTAMRLATGQVYAFLDADDRWLPDHLERKLGMLTSSSADVVYGTVDMFDDQSGEALFPWGPSAKELELFPLSLMVRNFIQPSGVLVRRSLVDEIGAFDPSIFLVEDIDLWLRAVRAGKKFVYDCKITTRYRKNHATASTTGRMVLCYDGVATVVGNYSDLITDSSLRNYLVGKHFVTAGLGHLSYAPTEHNRIQPNRGLDFLRRAALIDPQLWQAERWSILAQRAAQLGLLSLLRHRFKHGYKHLCHTPLDLGNWADRRAA